MDENKRLLGSCPFFEDLAATFSWTDIDWNWITEKTEAASGDQIVV